MYTYSICNNSISAAFLGVVLIRGKHLLEETQYLAIHLEPLKFLWNESFTFLNKIKNIIINIYEKTKFFLTEIPLYGNPFLIMSIKHLLQAALQSSFWKRNVLEVLILLHMINIEGTWLLRLLCKLLIKLSIRSSN